jgi:hypothetical protein
MKALTVFLALLLAATGANAQKTNSVKGTGTCIVANISPEKARETALAEAMKNALENAGIIVKVSGGTTLVGGVYIETYSTEIEGGITKFNILSDNLRFIEQGGIRVLIAEVEIDATVMMYSRKNDPAFQVRVEGIHTTYRENETLAFSVTPFQDGYLRIFLFEEDGTGSQLFPDRDKEPDALFAKGKEVRFPRNGHYYYRLEKTDRTKNAEINYLLILFLKDDIHFNGNHVTLQDVLTWNAGIPPDRRIHRIDKFVIER